MFPRHEPPKAKHESTNLKPSVGRNIGDRDWYRVTYLVAALMCAEMLRVCCFGSGSQPLSLQGVHPPQTRNPTESRIFGMHFTIMFQCDCSNVRVGDYAMADSGGTQGLSHNLDVITSRV